MRSVLVCAALFVSCGGGAIPSGGKCNDSEQCAAGLLCDTTQKPAICTDKLSNPPPDLAGADLAGQSADMATDMASSDLSASTEDMATTVDLAHKD